MKNNKLRNLTSKSLPVLSASLACFMWSQSASGANVVWNGEGDGSAWEDGDNWVSNTAPANNDYQDDAVFSSGTPTTVTMPSGRKVGGISFETAGWTIGSIGEIKRLSSTGTGGSMNTIGNIYGLKATGIWNVVGVGHTLKAGEIYLRDESITLAGGGTFWTTARLGGYGPRSFTVQEGVFRVDSSAAFSDSSGTLHIGADTGFLQLMTSNIASVEAMFGSSIIDDTGFGLQAVYDDVSGYTTVSAVPEPGSFALLAGSLALLTIMVKRRR
tara:strand:+ start:4653 stop:5465 length:813 start_codon:yes stop_codon:yes gene_type:complete